MRKFLTLSLLLTCGLVFIVSTAFQVGPSVESDNWTLITSDSGIEAYCQIAHCDQGEVYLFKIKNTTDNNQRIEVEITILNEPAYGSQTFIQDVSAKSETSGLCAESDLQLPKMVEGSDLSKVSVNLTSK